MQIHLALLVLAVVLYPVGVRFVGRPLAEFSWRFWTQKPYTTPTLLSYLLYPMAHMSAMHGIPMQEYLLPDKQLSNQARPGNVPLICEFYLYGEPCGTSEGYVPGNGAVWVRHRKDLRLYPDAEARYIRHASWAWLPRLAILPVCHAMAICGVPGYVYRLLARSQHGA